MKAEASYVVYEEVFISCSARAEKAENQGQGSIVRATELHIWINSQWRQNCHAKVRPWLGKNGALTHRIWTFRWMLPKIMNLDSSEPLSLHKWLSPACWGPAFAPCWRRFKVLSSTKPLSLHQDLPPPSILASRPIIQVESQHKSVWHYWAWKGGRWFPRSCREAGTSKS